MAALTRYTGFLVFASRVVLGGLTLAVRNLVTTGLLARSLVSLRTRLLRNLRVGAAALVALLTLGRVGGRGRGLGTRVRGSLSGVVSVSGGGESSVGGAQESDLGGGRSNESSGLPRGRGDGSEDLSHD